MNMFCKENSRSLSIFDKRCQLLALKIQFAIHQIWWCWISQISSALPMHWLSWDGFHGFIGTHEFFTTALQCLHKITITYLCTYFNLPYKTCFLFATYTYDTLGPNHVKKWNVSKSLRDYKLPKNYYKE